MTKSDDAMLTLEAAAELMQWDFVSVAMLIDNKKLAGATVTADGKRSVPESSVRAYIAQLDANAKNADYRAAAEAAGMYDIPEEVYIEVLTRRHS